MMWNTPALVQEGRFVAVPHAYSLTEAKAYCETTYSASGGGLASIHSATEQGQAYDACAQLSGVGAQISGGSTGVPHGCWIGLNQRGNAGTFTWTDGSIADFANWQPGEPNNCPGLPGRLSGLSL